MTVLGKIVVTFITILCVSTLYAVGVSFVEFFAENGFMGIPEAVTLYLFILLIYFIPTFISMALGSGFWITFLINFFIGWSLIGWIVSFVIACRK